MENKFINLNAITIRGRDYGDADRILILYSLECGKISCIAKGIRKIKSKNRAACQLFTQGKYSLRRGKGLPIITQAESQKEFSGIWEDLYKIAYAGYFAELIDISTEEEKANRELYILLLTILTLLEISDEPEVLSILFELRLLKLLGYEPHLQNCIHCGRSLNKGKFILSYNKGGLVCYSCKDKYNAKGEKINLGNIKYMQKLLNIEYDKLFNIKINAQNVQEIEKNLDAYLIYYLERASRAKKVLKELKDQ